MDPSFLIVGGDSQIGQALRQELAQRGAAARYTSRRGPGADRQAFPLDLATFAADRPWGVEGVAAILCAGITDLRTCEAQPETTRFINVAQTLRLARWLADQGCFLVFLSTNLVFDGSRPLVPPSAPTCPMTEYGRQKAQVEEALLASGMTCAIVRLTKVIGQTLPLLQTWQRRLQAGQPIHPFLDYSGSFVSLSQVVGCLIQLATGRRPGLWHLSSPDEVSYATLAELYLKAGGLDASLSQPMLAREAGLSLPLPAHPSLDATLTEAALGLTFPPSQRVFLDLLTHVIPAFNGHRG